MIGFYVGRVTVNKQGDSKLLKQGNRPLLEPPVVTLYYVGFFWEKFKGIAEETDEGLSQGRGSRQSPTRFW